jgi:hypothetical protein
MEEERGSGLMAAPPTSLDSKFTPFGFPSPFPTIGLASKILRTLDGTGDTLRLETVEGLLRKGGGRGWQVGVGQLQWAPFCR